ncbi:hypothetical protein DSECCO2_569780 [anaerobic digester metagenome]
MPVSTTRIRSLSSVDSQSKVMLPTSVNLMALPKRLMMICSSRRSSAGTVPTRVWISSFSSSPLLLARCATSSMVLLKVCCSTTSVYLSSSCPASILEMSSTSLIRDSKWRELVWTICSCLRCSSLILPGNSCSRMPVKPMMEFNGVRNSWDIVARNEDFSLSATFACSSA